MSNFLKILSIISILFILLISCSDDPPPVTSIDDGISYADTSEHLYAELLNSYGGAGYDWGTAILPTADNGYIITGSTDSYGVGNNTLYVVKTDSTGTLLWDSIYGGTGEDNAEAMVIAPDGSYTIGGVTSSFTGGYDFYLLNISSSGTLNWEKTIGTDNFEWGTDLIALDDGYAMCGYQIPSDLSDGGDFYLARTDLNGNVLWEKSFNRPNREWPFALTQTQDGGFVMAGHVHYDGSTNLDAYLIKTDDTGKFLWEETYGGSGNEHLFAIVESSDGSLIVNGSTRSFGSANAELLYLFKTNALGVMQWEKVYGTVGNIQGRSLIENNDGTFIFTGLTNSDPNGTGIVKTDANGNLLWNESIGFPGTGMSIFPLGENRYIVTGFASEIGIPDMLLMSIIEKE